MNGEELEHIPPVLSDHDVLCPHRDCGMRTELHHLPEHLVSCVGSCVLPLELEALREGPPRRPVAEACSHLGRYEELLIGYLADARVRPQDGEDDQGTMSALVRCPHEDSCAARGELIRAFELPSHLEMCSAHCSLPDGSPGHCEHLLSIDGVLEMTAGYQPQSPPLTNSQTFRQGLHCPHERCNMKLGLDELADHMTTCADKCDGLSDEEKYPRRCSHQDNLESFLNSFLVTQKASNLHSQAVNKEESNILLDGQPPVFVPPVDASKEEISSLRRFHRERIKKLSPDEKKKRTLERNRRTAKISRQRKEQEQNQVRISLKALQAEVQQLREALTAISRRNKELEQLLIENHTDEEDKPGLSCSFRAE
mmetsp:Transcript_11397/g.23067  ORF Transcript_11397/g.23067 Transcript_11397/m.23067 type:complete len:368 (-) Transcript_11397:297-1400(-)